MKNLVKKLLFPHPLIVVTVLPASITLLVYSMVVIGTDTPIAYLSYFLSAYAVTITGVRIPQGVKHLKNRKNNNKYIIRWLNDAKLRSKLILLCTTIFNAIYGILNLFLGYVHSTFWFYSLGFYYLCLVFMRLILLCHTDKNDTYARIKSEFKKYRCCGIIFLILNISISFIIFFMVYWNRTFYHNEITTIAIATYTFSALTIAIINIAKKQKSKVPIQSASRIISLTAACVSVLTLESTMLTTFGSEGTSIQIRQIMLGASGGVVSFFIIGMSIFMIVTSTRHLNELNQ